MLFSLTNLNGIINDCNPTVSPPAIITDEGTFKVLSKANTKELENSLTPFLVPLTKPSSNGFNNKLKVPLTKFVTVEKASKLVIALPAIFNLEPKLV